MVKANVGLCGVCFCVLQGAWLWISFIGSGNRMIAHCEGDIRVVSLHGRLVLVWDSTILR